MLKQPGLVFGDEETAGTGTARAEYAPNLGRLVDVRTRTRTSTTPYGTEASAVG